MAEPDPEQRELIVPPLAQLRRRRSTKWQTHPPHVLPLHIAETDYETAPPVMAALREAVDSSDLGYGIAQPVTGTGLGEAFSGFAERRHGWRVDPGLVSPVLDVGVGVVELLRVLAGSGQRVVISPPIYSPTFAWLTEAGARVQEVPLTRGDEGYRLDLAGLERAFAGHPAAYVLGNPHNPVGRVHSAEELEQLVRLARVHQVPIVADEIHGLLVLPGSTWTPILTVPGADEVAFSVTSPSKAFNLPGLKCAVVVAGSPPLHALIDRFPPDTRWRIGHLGVIATIAAYTEGDSWLDDLLFTLDRRRSQLGVLLAERLPSVRWNPPEGTFLAWLDADGIGCDGEPWELFLRNGVALDAGSRFGAPGAGFVRLNFATSPEILTEAVSRMATAIG